MIIGMESRAVWLLVFLFSAAMMVGCSSSNSEPDNTVAGNVSVTGLVRTPDNVVLADVEAYNGDGVLATSDSSGVISFSIAASKAGSIRLRKSGYAAQTVMLNLNNNRANFLATLGKRNAASTVSADAAINVTGVSGAMVSLAAGALVDASGNVVTGDVQLSITPVDVSDDDELGVFPGAFSGTDINGNAAPVIMSYGTVEYQFSQNGEELNLAAGQSATIEIPVFVVNHPDGTPIQIGDSGALWYLDETTGQWIQENVGIVVVSINSPTGMALQATVTHFSWWNHDIAPQVCDLSVTTSGLPADADIGLFARTQSDRPRSGSTTFLSDGQTLIMPRGVSTYFESTAKASDGFYTTSSVIDTCDGVADSLVLNYTGPDATKIMSFNGRVKPIFDIEPDPANLSSSRQVLIRNDAVFTWEVLGAESMALTSDQGHVTTLGSATGSTQFPLELSGIHAPQYAFTLTATAPDNTDTAVVSLTYDAAPAPVLNEFNSYQALSSTKQTATVTWDVEGADSISISYSPFYSGNAKTQFATDPDVARVGATVLDLKQDIFDVAGEGNYTIFVEFTNQYGTTTSVFFVWVYDPAPPAGGGGDGGGGTDGPPT